MKIEWTVAICLQRSTYECKDRKDHVLFQNSAAKKRSSALYRHIAQRYWQFFNDVAGQRVGSIFKGQEIQEPFLYFLTLLDKTDSLSYVSARNFPCRLHNIPEECRAHKEIWSWLQFVCVCVCVCARVCVSSWGRTYHVQFLRTGLRNKPVRTQLGDFTNN